MELYREILNKDYKLQGTIFQIIKKNLILFPIYKLGWVSSSIKNIKNLNSVFC